MFVESEFGIKRFQSEVELIQLVDCIDIVTPTKYHSTVTKKAINLGKRFYRKTNNPNH